MQHITKAELRARFAERLGTIPLERRTTTSPLDIEPTPDDAE